MSQKPPNSPKPKNKRKSRSRRGSDGISPKKSPPPPFWQNIVSNLLRGINGFLQTRAFKLPALPWIGIIGVIVAIAIWAISNFFSAKPNRVANITPTQEIPISNIEKKLEVTPTPSTNKEKILPKPETEAIPPSQIIPIPSINQEIPLPESEAIPPSQIIPTPSIDEKIPLPEPETEAIPPSQIIPTPSIDEKIPLPESEAEAIPPSQIIPTPSIDEKIPLPKPETEVIPPSQITPTLSIDEETPIPEPETTPTPTPKILLTPEQALIAAIENQVAEISDRIAPGLIQLIQANFRTSSLTVTIGNQWYDLPISEQRKLAAQMLQRSQELDFSHLEIMDAQKRLVARNPVVGTEVILFTGNVAN